MHSPYSLLARKNSAGKIVYYVRFWLEAEKRYAAARSSGQSSKAGALLWADEYLRNGSVITTRHGLLLTRSPPTSSAKRASITVISGCGGERSLPLTSGTNRLSSITTPSASSAECC